MWEGETASTGVLAEQGCRILAEQGTDLGPEPGEHWYTHRHDVSYKLAPMFASGGFADTMEVATLWSKLPALYAGVRRALGRHGVVMAHLSHAYSEGCSIYFTFACVGGLPVYDAAWADALAAAAEAGGTVAHHHGVGQLKQRAAAAEMSGIGPLFYALKARLDPNGILNPDRMFPRLPHSPPPKPVIGVDPVSHVATLDAQEGALSRDAWLAEQGWVLRFPTQGTLAEAARRSVEPWEIQVVGASVFVDAQRVVLRAVPRSAAGPDPRTTFAPALYETLTVPVVPLDEPTVVVAAVDRQFEQLGVRPARRLPGGQCELRGPASSNLAALFLDDGAPV